MADEPNKPATTKPASPEADRVCTVFDNLAAWANRRPITAYCNPTYTEDNSPPPMISTPMTLRGSGVAWAVENEKECHERAAGLVSMHVVPAGKSYSQHFVCEPTDGLYRSADAVVPKTTNFDAVKTCPTNMVDQRQCPPPSIKNIRPGPR